MGYGPGGMVPGEYGPDGGGMIPEGKALLPLPLVDRMTHARENITFPQLRWQAVIIGFPPNSGLGAPIGNPGSATDLIDR